MLLEREYSVYLTYFHSYQHPRAIHITRTDSYPPEVERVQVQQVKMFYLYFYVALYVHSYLNMKKILHTFT